MAEVRCASAQCTRRGRLASCVRGEWKELVLRSAPTPSSQRWVPRLRQVQQLGMVLLVPIVSRSSRMQSDFQSPRVISGASVQELRSA